MNKKLYFIIFVLFVFFIGCTNGIDNKDETNEYYTVTIIYENNNNETITENVKVLKGELVSEPDISRDNYTLLGFFNEESKWNFESDKVNSDVTLVAKWEESAPIYYSVTFNINDDENNPRIETITVKSGEKISALNLPILKNKEFGGFYVDDKKWDLNVDVVSSDLVLVARWIDVTSEYDKVIELIDNINANDYETIKIARKEYEELTEDDKGNVTNYNKLYQAEVDYTISKYNGAKTQAEYEDVITLIESLSNDVVNGLTIDLQALYNKTFEETYSEKIKNANSDQQTVIKSVAKAYLYKGAYNQYDQTRRVNGCSPYEASVYDTLYMDCSCYAYSVYTYVFGSQHNLKLSTGLNESYASGHQSNSDIVYYIKNSDYSTTQSQKALLTEIYNNLQVGDCINYRHGKSSGSSGHIVMYIGNDTIIHSTGSFMSTSDYSSNPDLFKEKQTSKEKEDGTVFTFSAKDMFLDTSNSRYLFKKTSSDSVWSFAIIRPTAKSTTMTVSNKSISNYLLEDVDIYETSDVGARRSVLPGQEMIFTLNLVNHRSNNIKNIPIYKQIGEDNYELLETNENGIYVKGKGVYHSVDLKANETKKIIYKVKVKDNAVGTISEGETKIHNIVLPKMSNTVTKNLNEELFVSNCIELMEESYSCTTDYIIDCYKNSGFDLRVNFNLTNKDLTFLNSGSYIVSDLYNGTKVKRLLQNALEVGDVLSIYNQATKVYTNYLYVSEEMLVKVEDGGFVKTNSKAEVQEILDRFFAYSKWAVCRPTMKTA